MADNSLVQVKVSGVSTLRDILGKDTPVVLCNGATVGDLIARLEEMFGPSFRKTTGEGLMDSITKRWFKLTVNGKILSPLEDLGKPLMNGDEILFFQFTGA